MKTAFIAILATLLTGCAGQDFARNFGDGMQAQTAARGAYAQSMQKSLQGMQTNPVKQTDFQCLNGCTNSGYQYAFCTSKCSY